MTAPRSILMTLVLAGCGAPTEPLDPALLAGPPGSQLKCARGSYDLDGQPTNGCEYSCTYTSASDDPDPDYEDTNCDGVDGIADDAIFVSPSGSSRGEGTLDSPLSTVQAGIDRAVAEGKTDVLIAQGTYLEAVDLASGVALHGGYVPVGGSQWDRVGMSQGATRITHDTTAARAIDLAYAATLSNLEVVATSPQSGTSITVTGLQVQDSMVVLEDAWIQSEDGRPGAHGASGTPGLPGMPGAGGEDGTMNELAFALGGPGGTSACGADGGSGGWGTPGGITGFPGMAGQSPTSSGCTGLQASGGAQVPGRPALTGSICGPWFRGLPNPGEHGEGGCDGQGGMGGAYDPAMVWVGQNGSSGTWGASGGGGSGGGGGGGSDCPFTISDSGGGGGGGGGGGCGGGGGLGGTGGGGSFAVLAVDGVVLSVRSILLSGHGGRGGDGGVGGPGGAGGSGGAGGAQADDSSPGGDGGLGGYGGPGGCGGGGAGGRSHSLFLIGGSTYYEIDSTFGHGLAGLGGHSSCGNHGAAGSLGAVGTG